MAKDYSTMTGGQLEELRAQMLDRIASVPQFRRGSLQVGYRKCGKANCRCARPGEQGHGPRGLWTCTAKAPGVAKGQSRGQYVPVEQVDQVRAELDNYAQFASLVEDYVEVNEALCTARLVPPAARGSKTEPATSGQKGGSRTGQSSARTRRKL